MLFLVDRLDVALVLDVGAAEFSRFGVEYLFINTVNGNRHAVVFTGNGLEVADDQDLAAVERDPAERDNAVLIVVERDPTEAVPVVVVLMHSRRVEIELVRGGEEVLELLMLFILEEVPLELGVGVPLVELTDFRAHEHELLARVREHVRNKAANALELLVVAAGHFIDKRTLAVHDLVVRNGQHEVLGERIDHAEGKGVVVIVSPQGIERDVGQHVVHPAHVPLVVKAETQALDGITGDVRPSGALLGDHHNLGVEHVDNIVELLEEVDRHKILSAAVGIGDPLAVLAVVVEVEHGSDRVHTDTVDVIHIEPEHSGGDQEAGDLISAVVEDIGAPLLVLADPPVLILIAAGAVKAAQTVRVLGEVSRYPVEDNADALLVSAVNKIHQILRLAVTGGSGIVAGHLVAPAAVEGEFGEGHKLDVGVAHLFYIGDQLVRQCAVVVEVAVLIFFPGAGIDLVDVDRLALVRIILFPLHPFAVVPLVVIDMIGARSVVGTGLAMERIGIGL